MWHICVNIRCIHSWHWHIYCSILIIDHSRRGSVIGHLGVKSDSNKVDQLTVGLEGLVSDSNNDVINIEVLDTPSGKITLVHGLFIKFISFSIKTFIFWKTVGKNWNERRYLKIEGLNKMYYYWYVYTSHSVDIKHC